MAADVTDALRGLVRSWLTRDDPVAVLRARVDAGGAVLDREALAVAASSGLLGLLRSSEGGTMADLAVVVEENGRGLSSVPIAEIAVAARVLELVGDPRADAVAAGEQVWLPATSPEAILPGATEADGFVVLDGRSVVLAPARSVTSRRLLDLSRSWGSPVVTDGEPVAGDAAGLRAGARDALALLRAADGLGCALRLVDMTVRYVSEREQFGRPVGSFQAVKHACADMLLLATASHATVTEAAARFEELAPAARSRRVSSAKAYAGPACSEVAMTALQLHGGMGFTWEHDLHLLLRRCKTDELLDGTPREHRRALAPA